MPSPPLDCYIDDLYYIDDRAPYTCLKVFPMPSLHLMVNLGPGFQVHVAEHAQSLTTCTQSWWVGMFSTYHRVDWPPSVRFFGVHFKPGGASPFLPLPLSELHNSIVELDALWGSPAAHLREQLAEVPTLAQGFALLERFLLARLTEAPQGLPLVQQAIGQIEQLNGMLSMRALSEHIGISQNHLGTQFKRMVGIAPKELARIWRFAHVLRSLDPSGPVDWTLIAHQARFYDQSHFNKDFVAFTGLSPTDYLRLRRRFLAQHPEQARSSLGYLPIE